MASSTAELPAAVSAPPLLLAPLPLAFTLDLSCPLPLPTRAGAPAITTLWPFPVAGPSSVPAEDIDAYVSRRYYETLYLGELLFPIAGLVNDLERTAASHNESLDPIIAKHILGLSAIETRHRRTLAPVVAAAIAAVDGMGSGVDEPAMTAGLSDSERDVLFTAMELRVKCRSVAEGERGLPVKGVTEEFERRELLVQLVMLLFYRSRYQATAVPKKKKRKRRDTQPPTPLEDPDAALELLADRIGLWLAVAELGIGLDADDINGREKEDERSVSFRLKRFWELVLVPIFLPREATFLASFHLKVFGRPMPEELVPQKKPRKPKVTKRLSVDDGAALRDPPAAKMQRSTSRTSRMSANSPPPNGTQARILQRSVSRAASEHGDRLRRSRSSSMDPVSLMRDPGRPVSKQTIIRAPSGRDIFKGREVGLIRRTNSVLRQNSLSLKDKGTKDKGTSDGSQQRSGALSRTVSSSGALSRTTSSGLLGRRNTEQALRRKEQESQSQLQAQADAETLIFETPAKPKFNFRAPYGHPTPIHEEPSSAERGGSASVLSFVAETPMRRSAGVAETPVTARMAIVRGTPLARRDSDDDDLGGLMVMTDEEDGGDDDKADGARCRGVPETPVR